MIILRHMGPVSTYIRYRDRYRQNCTAHTAVRKKY